MISQVKHKFNKTLKLYQFKFFFSCLITIILIILMLTVFAHPGRTDQNGGHFNHSTGEYHYHTGQYAGREQSTDMPWWQKYLFLGLLPIVIGVGFWIFHCITNSLPGNILYYLEHGITNYINAKNYTDFCNKQLKEIKEKAIIPDGYEIGKDGLPKENNTSKMNHEYITSICLSTNFESINLDWGKSLTLYTVIDGWKLHLEPGCCGTIAIRKNIYSFYNKRYSLCKKCAANYNVPNMDWYVEYLKIVPQEKKYKLAKEEQKVALNKLQNAYTDCNKNLARFLMFFTPKKKMKLQELKKQYDKYILNK